MQALVVPNRVVVVKEGFSLHLIHYFEDTYVGFSEIGASGGTAMVKGYNYTFAR